MPQMHPLMWASIFVFSLACLLITFAAVFFSSEKSNPIEAPTDKVQSANMIWKW